MEWLVRLEAAKSRLGDERLTQNVAAPVSWHHEAMRWAPAQMMKSDDNTTTVTGDAPPS